MKEARRKVGPTVPLKQALLLPRLWVEQPSPIQMRCSHHDAI